MDTACMVQDNTYFNYKHPKLVGVELYLKRILMLVSRVVGNPLVQVTQKARFSHFIFMSEIATINNK